MKRLLIGIAAALVVAGWLFVLWANRFHITPAVCFLGLGWIALVAAVLALVRIATVSTTSGGDESWWRPAGQLAELNREKKSLLKAIKEIEFDREMGKMSKPDADELVRAYRARAIEVLKAIDSFDAGAASSPREQIERELKVRAALDSKKKPRVDKAAVALLLLAAALAPTPATAQPLEAMQGTPLPASDLPAGTVTVRVIAGDLTKPVAGVDVTLSVAGTPRTARTDSTGRATLPNVPAGAQVQAQVAGENGPISSKAFPMPGAGGIKLMLSTTPIVAGAGAAAPAPGGPAGQAMPAPREMSGQARPQPGDPPGTLTVRVAHNDFAAPAVDHPVLLVGYGADETVSTKVTRSDKDGRAVFGGLDVSGGTAYYAMTLLTRGTVVDRVFSPPILMGGDAGIRLILSGEKKDSTAPPIEDLERADPQAVEAGKLLILLDGAADDKAAVELVDALTNKVIAQTTPTLAPPDAGTLEARLGAIEEDPLVPAGTLRVHVVRKLGDREVPIPKAELLAWPGAADKRGAPLVAAVDNGDASFRAPHAGAPHSLAIKLNGIEKVAGTVTMPSDKGAKVTLYVEWGSRGAYAGIFDVGDGLTGVDHAYYAQTSLRGLRYRTLPFQLTAGRGARVTISVFPRLLFTFRLAGEAEDNFLGFQGRFDVQNWSWFPYRASPDGMVVAMPDGFVGGVVADQDAQMVSTDPKGFRILRPLPPGGVRFHAGFSLKAVDGVVRWDMDLPLGSLESTIQMVETEGMNVEVPPSVRVQPARADNGTPLLVLPRISILPKQRMVMTVSGLPSPPAWKAWGPRIVGVVVMLVMIGGLAVALLTRRGAAASAGAQARIEQLYDELIAIDGGGGDAARRAQVVGELESLLATSRKPAAE